MSELARLLIGFALTTVLVGSVGVLFQRRSWEHQHKAQVADIHRAEASNVFDEISHLLDRRLYRVSLLHWRLRALAEGRDQSDLDQVKKSYRDVLRDWNEGINRNLALLEIYFGVTVREKLDYDVGPAFVEVGRSVEKEWLRLAASAPALTSSSAPELGAILDAKITDLQSEVYQFNMALLQAIRQMDGPPSRGRLHGARKGTGPQKGAKRLSRPPARYSPD